MGMIQVFRTRKPVCTEDLGENDWTADSAGGLDVPSRLYSLSSLRAGKDEANPVILPGDVIVVQKAAPVYITGEVLSPQGLYLKEGGLSLSEAVAKIGGVKREAKTRDIKIYRLKPNSKDREIIAVNYDQIRKGEQKDVMLEPYDIIEVDKAKESIAMTILKIATGTARQASRRIRQRFADKGFVLSDLLFGVRVDLVDHVLILFIDHAPLYLQRRRQFAAFDRQFIFEKHYFLDRFISREFYRRRCDLPFQQVDRPRVLAKLLWR